MRITPLRTIPLGETQLESKRIIIVFGKPFWVVTVTSVQANILLLSMVYRAKVPRRFRSSAASINTSLSSSVMKSAMAFSADNSKVASIYISESLSYMLLVSFLHEVKKVKKLKERAITRLDGFIILKVGFVNFGPMPV